MSVDGIFLPLVRKKTLVIQKKMYNLSPFQLLFVTLQHHPKTIYRATHSLQKQQHNKEFP